MSKNPDIRVLMKAHTAKVSDTAMSARERAQMLKSLNKEKRKTTLEAVSDTPRKLAKVPEVLMKSSEPIPNDFYEAPAATLSSELNTKEVEISAELVKISAPASALPEGFFDDIAADFNARGLNIHEEVKKKEVEMNTVLNDFLTTVNGKLC